MAVDRAYQALNLVRYSVPSGSKVVVVEGVCMVVRRHFILRGILVLDGILQIGGGV